MSREMFKGNSHQVVVEGGGKIFLPDTESQMLKMNFDQKHSGTERGFVTKITTKEATKMAEKLGFNGTNYTSNGQKVFQKGNIYHY